MNKKQSIIDKVLHIVVDCCSIDIDGEVQITAEDVRGRCRKDSVCMTRCIFVKQMVYLGYSRSTIAAYLHRDVKSIGNLIASANAFYDSSRAYRIAEAEATLLLKDIDSNI